jgi:hypothetical protein
MLLAFVLVLAWLEMADVGSRVLEPVPPPAAVAAAPATKAPQTPEAAAPAAPAEPAASPRP